MPIENGKIPAKKLVLFFVVDTSYSMEGAKIEALNNAVEEILPMVGQISKDNNDTEIEIAVLQFSSGAKWLYSNPVPAAEFLWKPMTAEGNSDFGAACTELALKLTTKADGFMRVSDASSAPIFILLSCSDPTDEYLKLDFKLTIKGVKDEQQLALAQAEIDKLNIG